MSSQHKNPGLTVRPDVKTRKAAQQELNDRGLEMKAFVEACLCAVATNPDAFLAQLRAHWPPQAKRGRPWPAKDRGLQQQQLHGEPD